MERLQAAAVILSLVERLGEVGSWSGETHVQKASYFLKELLGVPLGFKFVLYRHGPYSFDLRDEISAMRADGLLAIKPKPYPYGPSIVQGDESPQVTQRYSDVIVGYQHQVEFAAERLGRLDVAGLERVATALYVTREQEGVCSVEQRAKRLHELKQHVSLEQAKEAIAQVDAWITEAHLMTEALVS